MNLQDQETINKDVNLSYWQRHHYQANYDLIIIGSGIVGMCSALEFKRKHPKSRVLILEKSRSAWGASVKNAGFACFGSPSEVLSDINSMGLDKALQLVEMRVQGLELLLKQVNPKKINYQNNGGYELFWDPKKMESCLDSLNRLNGYLKPITGQSTTYTQLKGQHNWTFKSLHGALFNALEGEINPQLLVHELHKQCIKLDIEFCFDTHVLQWHSINSCVNVVCSWHVFTCNYLLLCSNGFSRALLPDTDLVPARAQVLITKPLEGLNWKGCFHFEEGYYYFRAINRRILFGGGRQTDFKTETTDRDGINNHIQSHLKQILQNQLFPSLTPPEIEFEWSGIMGMGSEKGPLIENPAQNVFTAIRMGGMGLALACKVAQKLVKTYF